MNNPDKRIWGVDKRPYVEDPLGPALGVIYGLWLVLPFWLVVATLILWMEL